jgi:Ca2+-binding EF-hand superfamily protein
MEHLTEGQIEQCRELFASLDLSGSGVLGAREIGVVLRALGMEVTESDVMDLVATAGTSGVDGAGVGFSDFLRLVVVGALGDKDPVTELEEAFKEMDEGSKDGLLSTEDLLRTAERHGRVLSAAEAAEMLREGRGARSVGDEAEGVSFEELRRVVEEN